MATIFHTKRGWTVQWSAGKDRAGRRLRDSRTFPTEAEAIAYSLQIEASGVAAGGEPFEVRAMRWISERHALGKVSDKTRIGYEEKARAWARLLPATPYKRIRTADIDAAFAKLARGETPTGRKPSPRTLHHYRRFIGSFFRAMVKKAEVSRNPVDGVEPISAPDRTRRAPTGAELAVYLEAAEASGLLHGQLRTLLELLLHTGLRRGEALALQWATVDLDGRALRVERAVRQPARSDSITFGRTKTEASRRTVALAPDTVELLRAQRRRVAAWQLAAGSAWAAGDLVFCTPVGEVLNPEQVTRAAGTVRTAAGLPREVLPLHGARHANLTALAAAAVPVSTIMARAGHTSIATTMRYVSPDADADRAAAAVAAAAFGRLTKP